MKDQLIEQLKSAVINMDTDNILDLCNEYLSHEYDPMEAINLGLSKGMEEVGKLYEEGDYFIPELLICSEVMYMALDQLTPHISRLSTDHDLKAIVGVVEGDTHDIGKNLLKTMLMVQGFEVIDLGIDVSPENFLVKIEETKPHLLGLSTLMSTSMANMEKTINLLNESDFRDRLVIMIGGGPVTESFANRIGADAYEADASSAATTAKRLVLEKMNQ